MFMPTHITAFSIHPGSRSIRLTSGKGTTSIDIILSIDHITISSLTSPYHPLEIYQRSKSILIQFCVRPELVTVLVLYEGLLVNFWTTALNRPRPRWGCSAQLAILLALLAIAGGAADISKLPPSPPHDYSNYPSSSLALSRSFIPCSDISIIRKLCNSTIRSKRESDPAVDNHGAVLSKPAELSRNISKNELEGVSASVNNTRVTLNETLHRNHSSPREKLEFKKGTQQSMPPAHAQDEVTGGAASSTFSIFLVAILVTGVVLGLVTCLLSHHQQWGQAGPASRAGTPATQQENAAPHPPTITPMLSVVSAGAAAGMGGMERLRSGGGGGRSARELAAARDRQVRLHSVRTDLAVNLPPRIGLPDGEDHHHHYSASHARLHLRDHEQESEIYQKCIRPPPNRTVLESESPPPYRSSSAGMLPSSSSSSSSSSTSSSGSDWSSGSGPLVVRCHSMSSTSKPGSQSGTSQKTDFLQRTVKIFTGGKKGAPTQQPAQPGRGRPRPPPAV